MVLPPTNCGLGLYESAAKKMTNKALDPHSERDFNFVGNSWGRVWGAEKSFGTASEFSRGNPDPASLA